MMRRSILLGIAVLLVTATAAPAATTSVKVPFSQFNPVPCAAGGAGEVVFISGTLHIVNGVTIDAKGGIHAHLSFQPQGASGVGLTTGDTYRATGGTRFRLNINSGGLPITDSIVNNFRLIGPGPGNNLQVHINGKFTLNENGTITVDFVKISVTCG